MEEASGIVCNGHGVHSIEKKSMKFITRTKEIISQ